MDELEKKAQELLEKGFAKNLQEAKALAEKLIAEKALEIQKAFDEKAKDLEEKHKTEIEALTIKMDERDKQIDEALTKMNRLKEQERKEKVKTISGAIFEELAQKEEQLKSFNKGIGRKSLDIEVNGFDTKAVGVMGVAAGSVNPEFQAPIGIPRIQEHLRQVIPVSPTQSNLIKYVQFTKKEGSIGTVAAGAAKPQIDYNTTVKEAPVRKIAGWLRVHDEFLEDIVGARDFLASELPQALLDVEDDQILNGDGTGENLTGLMTVAAALALPVGSVTTESNAWDRIAAGLTQIRRANRSATAIWVSPEDYLELLINKGTTEEYTYPLMVTGLGQVSVGGVPVFQHNALAAGTGLAGDFARGVRIFQRQGAIIKFSTEDATNFTSNLTTVLIEERIALPIYFPDSFVKYDFTVTPVV